MEKIVTDLVLNPEEELTPEERSKVESYKSSIDFSRPDQTLQYSVAAQSRLTNFADNVLATVRSRDMGEVGKLLSELSVDLRKFDSATKKDVRILGFFKSLKRKVAYLQAEYNKVEKNISLIGQQLQKHVQTLVKDIYIFNEQYEENWNYFRELTLYIVAGKEKIAQMHNEVLPQMKEEAQRTQDDRLIQQYNDCEQQVNRFEKKIHDMKLSRMISIQLAPQIRMVQNNSLTMVDKIQSTIMNTLPLWKNQMVLSLGLAHAQQALEAQKKVTDATNQLLKSNSEMLKQSTRQIASESERGIVDMDTIRKANEDLIQSMEDLVKIQAEGREKRLAVEVELKAAEDELKKRLLQETSNQTN
ncbi:MAG: toxic anion resistance protein [Tannerellaceae bacterium]|nr:toxic anion resistance protein [Tannerellaceae bacterium]